MCVMKVKLSNKKILDSTSPTKKTAINAVFRRVIKGPRLQTSKDLTVLRHKEEQKRAVQNLLIDNEDYAPLTKKKKIDHQPRVIEPNKTSVSEIMRLLDLADADEQQKKKIIQEMKVAAQEKRREVANNYRCQMFIEQREAMIEVDQFFRGDVIRKCRQRLEKKLCPLISEICEISRVAADRDIEKIYQKILIVITMMSGLGNSMTPPVLKEAAMALQTVYLPSEVTNFVTYSRKAKNKQLVELMSIVAGIRLFNKDCQRGGQGIDNLPTILQESLEKSQNSTLELLENLMIMVYRLTAAVDNSLLKLLDKKKKSVYFDYQNFDDFKLIISTLTTCRQQEIYVRKILSDLENIEDEFKNLMEHLQSRLHKLHDTVKFRTAIPIVQVYPQFMDLTSIWMRLQDEVIVLNNINKFFEQLNLLSIENTKIYEEIRLEKFIKDSEILSDAERLERSMGKLINECGDCVILYPNTTKNFQDIQLEFLGFCAWTFVVGFGALIPGNPNIGIVKWRTRYFAFSSDEAAKKFGEDPSRFMYEALDFVRKNPEYIHLFHLHEDIEALNNQENTTQDYNLQVHQDQCVQTDTHILEPYIDPDYHHSLWNHRYSALKLANISKCMTKSTQTSISYFKRSASIQASVPKNTSSQTVRDNECNTTHIQTLIYNLPPKNQVKIINYASD